MTDLAARLRKLADSLAASLDHPQSRREAVLRDLQVSLLRDLLVIANESPEIDDGPVTDGAGHRAVVALLTARLLLGALAGSVKVSEPHQAPALASSSRPSPS
jgi:hypothetical protein